MKVKKGTLCAFEVADLEVRLPEHVGERAEVLRTVTWHIGQVNASTRLGKVREVLDASGAKYAMDSKHRKVLRVLVIPSDKVNGPRLLMDAEGRTWLSLVDCERFTAEHLRHADTLL